MTQSTVIRWDQNEDGIVVLTLDDPEHSANTMNAAYRESLAATVDRLEAEQDSITGVVITSAKKTFFAGADLNELRNVPKEKGPEVATMTRTLKPRDARQAGRRGSQRRRIGRRARDLPGMPSPDRSR